MFDVHVDLTLKLHLISNAFQISNFRFSLEYAAKEDNYHNTKWNQSQCCAKQNEIRANVTSFSRNDYNLVTNLVIVTTG